MSIISSSVLSAVLTSYFNWKLHDSNYKKDYYKKLLDKRLDAYESLNNLTTKLSTKVHTEHGMVHGLLCGSIGFDDFTNELRNTQKKSFWLDNITSHKLTELGTYLFNNVSCKIDDSLPEDEQQEKYLKLAVEHYNNIEDFKGTFRYFLNNEIKNLHNLDAFFNDSRKTPEKYPVNEKEY